jgi:RNA polymerase-binding transcription factor DksA
MTDRTDLHTELTSQQMDGLHEKIRMTLAGLIDQTRGQMDPDEKTSYLDIASNVPDAGDQSVADTLVDTDNAMIGLNLQQIRDLDGALARIDAGTYGTCIECGCDIGFERLSAYPTAKRCIECQSQYEKTHVGDVTHSL